MKKINEILEKVITFCLSASVALLIFITYAELTDSPANANNAPQTTLAQNTQQGKPSSSAFVSKSEKEEVKPAKSAPPAAPGQFAMKVEVTEAVNENFESTISTVGTLKSFESAEIRPEITGTIIDAPVVNGSYVKKGDLLLVIENSVQKAEYDMAQAKIDVLRNNLNRYRSLVQSGAASKFQVEETEANLKVAEADAAMAKAKYEKTYIRAPFEGAVGIRRVSIGDYVSPETVLVNIDQNKQLKLQFVIPEKYAGKLNVGTDIFFTTGKTADLKLSAKVTSIDSRVDEKTRGIMVEAIYDNNEGQVYPGQFADINIVLNKTNAIALPSQAIIPLGSKDFVYKVVDGKAEQYEVKLGKRTVDKVEVVEGVTDGEIIVTAGQQKIRDGASVRMSEPSIVELTYMDEEKPLDK